MAPGTTVNVVLVTDSAGLVTLAVRDLPLPAKLTLRLLKVATPVPEAVIRGVVPLSVPPPFRLMFTETEPTPLPNWSVTFTVTAGVKVAPAATDAGGPCKNEMELAA